MSKQTGWLEVDLHSWWSVKGKLGKATQSQPVSWYCRNDNTFLTIPLNCFEPCIQLDNVLSDPFCIVMPGWKESIWECLKTLNYSIIQLDSKLTFQLYNVLSDPVCIFMPNSKQSIWKCLKTWPPPGEPANSEVWIPHQGERTDKKDKKNKLLWKSFFEHKKWSVFCFFYKAQIHWLFGRHSSYEIHICSASWR